MPTIENTCSTTPIVTIIGGGITGLSAAHEFIERGFRVRVLERESNSPMDVARETDGDMVAASTAEIVDVGGIARTQWAVLPHEMDTCIGLSGHSRPIDIIDDDSPTGEPASPGGGKKKSSKKKAAKRRPVSKAGAAEKGAAFTRPELARKLARRRGQAAKSLIGRVRTTKRGSSTAREPLTPAAQAGGHEAATVPVKPLGELPKVVNEDPKGSFEGHLPGTPGKQPGGSLDQGGKQPGGNPFGGDNNNDSNDNEDQGGKPPGGSTPAGTPDPSPSGAPPIRLLQSLTRPLTFAELAKESTLTLMISGKDGKPKLDPALPKKLARWLKEDGRFDRLRRKQSWLQVVHIVQPGVSESQTHELTALHQKLLTHATEQEAFPGLDLGVWLPPATVEFDPELFPESFPGFGKAIFLSVTREVEGGQLVAGEHGYRFFAGFYRHLRETMKRTPIYEAERGEFGVRTALDNLREIKWQAIGDPQRAFPTAFPRVPVRSMAEAREVYLRVRRDLGYRPSDILRFMLRLVRYMTSSSERREACYEQLSWWDFLSLVDLRSVPSSEPVDPSAARLAYGARFAEALKHSPQALVAMKAEIADARTQGNVSVQLMMDNIGMHEMTDSTLTGPTSEAWFRHWRQYLEVQGVEFHVCNVAPLQRDSSGRIAPPQPTGADPWPAGERHYVLIATDLIAAAALTQNLPEVGALEGFQDYAYPKADPGSSAAARDPEFHSLDLASQVGLERRYQTLTGLQLFYPARIAFADAHVYFAESPWGLSAVSQYQYWRAYAPLEGEVKSRFLGNFSIDIGAWEPGSMVLPDGTVAFSSPSAMTAIDIAEASQTQIRLCLGQVGRYSAPYAMAAHVDDYIELGLDQKPLRNRYPYLINLIDDWAARPAGEPWSTLDRSQRSRVPGRGSYSKGTQVWQHEDDGYLVHFDNLVLAGTYMRTFTRLGTMESANESARHAVNAILDHLCRDLAIGPEPEPSEGEGCDPSWPPAPPWTEFSTSEPAFMFTPFGDYCTTWDLEQHEVPDLDFAKLIDRHLFEASLHQVECPPDPMYVDDAPTPNPTSDPSAPDFPHIFDLLGLDAIPDYIETDTDALKVLDALATCVPNFLDPAVLDLGQIGSSIHALKTKLAGLIPM
ncbi:hypothetical protein PPSIR1_22696 [Plesiocystis pacifica SIR-1]|uniref:Uncharacterized protein n=1 Tax=Plesiocystis pacifica SIR-1 TaxID=391625 RepID=A6G2G2_9BACT|nr:NAD(P)-binding protein [Plesiocystis pacifica]EDM79899.1 hypothetical protein PPSIR1_22696 [Plesiocystis pacifica SIR-1]